MARPEPFDPLTPKFDPNQTWVNFTTDQLELISHLKSELGVLQRPISPRGNSVAVASLLTHCGRDLLQKLGRMLRGDVLSIHPAEWKEHVVALFQDTPPPPPPLSPLQELIRKSQQPTQPPAIAPKSPERMTTPLYDEILRAKKELDDHYPGALSPEEEDRFSARLANFHGDEIRNWHDVRHKDLYPEPRVSRAELERRSSEILGEFASARARASGPRVPPIPTVEPRGGAAEDVRAGTPDLPRQADEISLSDAASLYDIPRATLSKYTKKRPGELNHLPSRLIGKSRLLKKHDVQNLRRSIQRRNRPDTRRRPLDSEE